MLTGLKAEDLSTLGDGQAGEVFKGVGDSVILTLPDDSKDAALKALDTSFFDRKTRSSIDLPKDTIIEQVELEAPPVFQELLSDITSIRRIT